MSLVSLRTQTTGYSVPMETQECAGKFGLNGDSDTMRVESPDGEIGRRSGLKIRGPETAVGVQVSLRAPAEEKRLRAVVAKLYPHRMPDLTIALGTGMRLSEQFSHTWEQVDFSRGEINLDRTKNGSGRTIPMNKAVQSSFVELKKAPLLSAKATVFSTQKTQEGGFTRL